MTRGSRPENACARASCWRRAPRQTLRAARHARRAARSAGAAPAAARCHPAPGGGVGQGHTRMSRGRPRPVQVMRAISEESSPFSAAGKQAKKRLKAPSGASKGGLECRLGECFLDVLGAGGFVFRLRVAVDKEAYAVPWPPPHQGASSAASSIESEPSFGGKGRRKGRPEAFSTDNLTAMGLGADAPEVPYHIIVAW